MSLILWPGQPRPALFMRIAKLNNQRVGASGLAGAFFGAPSV